MKYEEIKVGYSHEFERIISREDVLEFAALTGDANKLHVDESHGKQSAFGQNICHGMLAGGLFSTLIGMHLPGEGVLYLSQTLAFREPIFCSDKLKVRGTVISKNDAIKVVTIKTEICKDNKVAISGEARVKVLSEALD